MRIDGSVTLVTGGNSGLGASTVTELARRGGKAVILDVPLSDANQVPNHSDSNTPIFPTDVTVPSEVASSVNAVERVFGKINICVNAAGVNPGSRLTRSGPPTNSPTDQLRRALAVNLIGSFDVISHVAEVMKRNDPNSDGERGVIVNVASIAAFEGQAGQSAYAASKAGVVGLTLPLARELAPFGIRVMTVAPGIMDTPMFRNLSPDLATSLQALGVFPQRPGRPSEFAHIVRAIIENPFLNGEVIRLDGAMRLSHLLEQESGS